MTNFSCRASESESYSISETEIFDSVVIWQGNLKNLLRRIRQRRKRRCPAAWRFAFPMVPALSAPVGQEAEYSGPFISHCFYRPFCLIQSVFMDVFSQCKVCYRLCSHQCFLLDVSSQTKKSNRFYLFGQSPSQNSLIQDILLGFTIVFIFFQLSRIAQ